MDNAQPGNTCHCLCRQERFGLICANVRSIWNRAIRKRGLKTNEANTENTRGVGKIAGLSQLPRSPVSSVLLGAWWRSWTTVRLETVPWLPPKPTELEVDGET